VTPTRCQQVIFSNPIISDYVRAAYTSGSAPTSLKQIIASKQKVGILTGSTYISQFESMGMPASQLVQFTDIRSALSAMQAGRVGMVLGSASGFNIQGIPSSVKLSNRLSDIPASVSAFAFKKSDTALRNAVNTDLQKLESDGQYAKIAKQWGFTGKEIDGLSTAAACQASS
jgi:polar amino acid transport system substrate-binding protein